MTCFVGRPFEFSTRYITQCTEFFFRQIAHIFYWKRYEIVVNIKNGLLNKQERKSWNILECHKKAGC